MTDEPPDPPVDEEARGGVLAVFMVQQALFETLIKSGLVDRKGAGAIIDFAALLVEQETGPTDNPARLRAAHELLELLRSSLTLVSPPIDAPPPVPPPDPPASDR